MSEEGTPVTPAKVKKVKPPSRGERFTSAADSVDSAISDALSALEEFESVWQEYVDWKDNLPEGLSSSALGEKLEEVANLDLNGVRSSLEDAQSTVQEAAGMDLPLGFGRD